MANLLDVQQPEVVDLFKRMDIMDLPPFSSASSWHSFPIVQQEDRVDTHARPELNVYLGTECGLRRPQKRLVISKRRPKRKITHVSEEPTRERKLLEMTKEENSKLLATRTAMTKKQGVWAEPTRERMPLKMTAMEENSKLLEMRTAATEKQRVWAKFAEDWLLPEMRIITQEAQMCQNKWAELAPDTNFPERPVVSVEWDDEEYDDDAYEYPFPPVCPFADEDEEDDAEERASMINEAVAAAGEFDYFM